MQKRQNPNKRRNRWVIVGGAAAVIIIASVAGWTYHEQPQFCATCHIMQPYLASWNGSDFLAQAHAEADIACLDCHEPTIQQQVDEAIKFVKKDYEDPLKGREFPDEWCLRCHEHGSYEELIQRTQDYTVDGKKVNPHDPHAGLEGVDQAQIECRRCHKIHKESRGIDYCYGCHHSCTFESCSSIGCHGE